MATTHNFQNQDAILKDVYDERTMLTQSYQKNPFFAMIDKKIGEEAGGRRFIQAVEFENPGGASANYGKSRLNASISQYAPFILSSTDQFQYIRVQHKLMLATQTRPEAFVDALEQFDNGFKSLGQKIGRRMYRTLGGSLGQLALAAMNTTTISFADDASIFYLQLGMKLQFSDTDGTSTVLDGGDTVTVLSIDHAARTATVDRQLDTAIAGIATNSFVFQDGDYGLCLSGLEDWLPVDNRATRLAANFNNVVRSQAGTLLGGVFFDGSKQGSLDETIILMNAEIGNFNGEVDVCLTNPRQIADLVLVKTSKIRIEASVTVTPTDMEGNALTIGFPAFRVLIGDRSVILVSDRACPSTRLYELQMNTWRLWYTGKLINWQGEFYGEPRIKASRDTDDAEAQLSSYCNLGCRAPSYNGVAKLRASVA